MNGYLFYQKTKEMLKQGTRILLVLLVLLISCKRELTKEEEVQIEKERLEKACKKRAIYIAYSKKLIGEKEYDAVYKKANDTIENWVVNNLKCYIFKPYQLDSLLCFNSKKDNFFGALLIPCYEKKCVQDDIKFFYGVKIKEKWYFFRGSTLVLPREYYQDDIHKPLSFEKMKQIAIEEIFSGYLIEERSVNGSNKVKYKINEREFIDMESRNRDGTFGQYSKTFEEEVLREVNDNWKKKADSIQ
jgi:hypothetical protein